jgi:hypothetical protein
MQDLAGGLEKRGFCPHGPESGLTHNVRVEGEAPHDGHLIASVERTAMTAISSR